MKIDTGYPSMLISYKEVEMVIEYEATPYVPAVWYLSNGDPGYPAEGGEFNIMDVLVEDVSIANLLSGEQFSDIEQICIRDLKNRNDY